MAASEHGKAPLVKFLIDKGANVHTRSKTGDSALSLAMEQDYLDVVKILRYNGAGN
jgi:ankyrin repeat protein